MRLGIVGLGKMGSNIAARLTRKGHDVVVWDSSESAVSHTLSNCEKGRCEAVHSLKEVAEQLKGEKRRVIWCMLPAGEVTEETVQELALLLRRGDILIDGGNTYYKDDIRRFREFARRGLHYIDIGTSGGVWGLERGYCMMIGGEKKIAEYIRPILSALAPGIGDIQRTRHRGKEHHSPTAEEGYLYCGPAGAGHFVKMIHNGIEYGMMQAIAEGFDVLKSKNSPKLPAGERYDLNVADIAEVWRRGSVVTSWLLDLKAEALAHCSDLSGFTGEVADSGEGRWSIEAAIEEDVPVPVMTAALFARFRSRTGNNFTEKALSAMRFGFGGHKEPSRPSDEK